MDKKKTAKATADVISSTPMNPAIRSIMEENNRRNAEIYAPFDPISGFGSVGERVKVHIEDFPIRTQYLPAEIMGNAGDIRR